MNMNRVASIGFAIAVVGVGFVVAQTDQTNPIKWRTYNSGTVANSQRAFAVVIDNVGAWQNYWKANFGNPSQAPRDVDFNKEELVAIHLGLRPTGGYKVYVSSIQRGRPGEVTVNFVESLPIPGISVTQAQTTPWVIARLDRPGARISFQKSTEDGKLPGGISVIQLSGGGGIAPLGACGCSSCSCGCSGGGSSLGGGFGGGTGGGSGLK